MGLSLPQTCEYRPQLVFHLGHRREGQVTLEWFRLGVTQGAIGEVADCGDGGGYPLLNVDDGKTFTPVSCLGGGLRPVVLSLRSGFGLEVSAEVPHEV